MAPSVRVIPTDPTSSNGFRPMRSISMMAGIVARMFTKPVSTFNAQSPLFSCTCCFPQNLTEIKNDVDTDELLESSQTHSHPKHGSDTSRDGNNKIRQPGTAFRFEALFYLPHEPTGIAANSLEHLACLLVFADEDQIARRLGNCHAA